MYKVFLFVVQEQALQAAKPHTDLLLCPGCYTNRQKTQKRWKWDMG
jgi:hypothetical protein